MSRGFEAETKLHCFIAETFSTIVVETFCMVCLHLSIRIFQSTAFP